MMVWTRLNLKVILFIILVQLSLISILINIKTLQTQQNVWTVADQQDHVRSARKPSWNSTKIESVFTNMSVSMNYWIKRIDDYCAENKNEMRIYLNHEYEDTGVPSWVWMVSRQHSLFYCAAPKCSSTTWKSYLMEDLNFRWKEDVHGSATRLGLKQVAKRLNMELTYIRFLDNFHPKNRLIIVRNPWARLVSAYSNKILEELWTLETLCIAAGMVHTFWEEETTFEKFVKCLTMADRSVMWNSHVQPLASLCVLCHMNYNIIVKMEEMDSAEPFILNKLNSTNRFNYKPPAKGRFTNTYSKYYRNVPPEVLMELQDIYKHDIELFDYPASPFD